MDDRPSVVWLTGIPSSGKSTIAAALVKRLPRAYALDGDELRKGLCEDLGFSRTDRIKNMKRVAHVAKILVKNGITAISALISPYEEGREAVRAIVGGRFFEVYIKCPLHVCMARDIKGFYDLQRQGKLKGLTGIDDVYQPPKNPNLVLDTSTHSLPVCVKLLEKIIR